MRKALLFLVVAAGCGSSSGGGTPAVDAGADAATAKDSSTVHDPNAVIGAFNVELVPEVKTDTDTTPAHTTLSGGVNDGPTPPTRFWMTIDSGDGCQLQKPSAPFCDPACAGDDVCVDTNKCQSNPTPQDLGPVQVRGLGSAPFTSQFIAGNYQLPGSVQLPYPPAAEGADVSVAVSGGPYVAFMLTTKAVAVLSWTDDLVLDRDKPATLTWTAPMMPTLARLQIKVDISHHGGAKGQIVCDVPDSGTFSIPAKLVTGLINLGVAGFPSVTLTRISTGTASLTAGKVELQYFSAVTRPVKVAGYDSCNDKVPCPAGKTCDTMHSLCSP